MDSGLDVILCTERTRAFGDAWLVSLKVFLETEQPHIDSVEEVGGYNLFYTHRVVKARDPSFFWAIHMSPSLARADLTNHPERNETVRRIGDWQAKSSMAMCHLLREPHETAPRTLALIAFWGGVDQGIGHTVANLWQRTGQLIGTVCTAARLFSVVAVGGCSTFPTGANRTNDAEYLRTVSFDPATPHIVPLECEKPTHLPSSIVQVAQAKLRAGEWQADYIFFSSADHLTFVHPERGIAPAIAFLQRNEDVALSVSLLVENTNADGVPPSCTSFLRVSKNGHNACGPILRDNATNRKFWHTNFCFGQVAKNVSIPHVPGSPEPWFAWYRRHHLATTVRSN